MPADTHSSAEDRTTAVTLRAHSGQPLENEEVKRMVAATAHAIAERQGVQVLEIETRPDRIITTLRADRITAMGFAAELRRLTNEWRRHKTGQALWDEA